MFKKNKVYKIKMSKFLDTIYKFIVEKLFLTIILNKKIMQNIFRLSHKKRQFCFHLFSLTLKFSKTITTGVFSGKLVNKLKFFKKSLNIINPLIFKLKIIYKEFLKNMFMFESKNYTKKSYVFFKKLLLNSSYKINYLIFHKTWHYTTKPVKRVKKRVVKLLKKV